MESRRRARSRRGAGGDRFQQLGARPNPARGNALGAQVARGAEGGPVGEAGGRRAGRGRRGAGRSGDAQHRGRREGE